MSSARTFIFIFLFASTALANFCTSSTSSATGVSPVPALLEAVRKDWDPLAVDTLADWFLDAGDPRGEFIRASQKVRTLPPGDEAKRLRDRVDELLPTVIGLWLPPGADSAEFDIYFREGIPDYLDWSVTDENRAMGPAVLARMPIRRLRLFPMNEGVSPIDWLVSGEAFYPYLRDLIYLDLSSYPLEAEALRQVVQSPHLANVTRLHLGNSMTSRRARFFTSDSFTMRRLTWLQLTGSSVAGIEELGASPNLQFLQGLDVTNDLPENSYERVVNSAGVGVALANARYFGRLRVLRFADAMLGPEDARAIAASAILTRLVVLDLSDNMIRDAGAEAIAGSRALEGLRELRLSNNRIGNAGVRALGNSRIYPSLTVLDVTGNSADAAVISAAMAKFR